ncbi:hypothetical protein AALF16_17845 [Bacillus cereus]|uniref:hypothetical protein n=1 Tax=Bacillus cereus TaxID=1396 RepID=UPI00356F1F22
MEDTILLQEEQVGFIQPIVSSSIHGQQEPNLKIQRGTSRDEENTYALKFHSINEKFLKEKAEVISKMFYVQNDLSHCI